MPGKDAYNVPTIFWTDVNEIFPSELTNAAVNSSAMMEFTHLLLMRAVYLQLVQLCGYSVEIWLRACKRCKWFIKIIYNSVTNIPQLQKHKCLQKLILRAYGDSQLLLYYGQYNDPSSKYELILRDTFVTTANVNYPPQA